MRHEIRLLTALMIVSFGLSYWAAQPESEGGDDKVALFQVPAGQVDRVSLSMGKTTTVVEKNDQGKFWTTWTKIEEIKKKPKPVAKDEKDKETTEPVKEEIETKTTEDRFLASSKFGEILDDMNPFYAVRSVGSFDESQRKEFGFDDGAGKWVVGSGSKTFEFVIGKKSYGSSKRFILDPEKKRIYLVDGKHIESLVKANYRLYERKFVDFDWEDVTEVTVSQSDKVAKIVQGQRDAKGNLQWSKDEDGAKPVASYKTWMKKIADLKLTKYATEKDGALATSLESVFKLAVGKKGKALGNIEFLKRSQAGKTEYWVTSSYIGTYARVSQSKLSTLEKDVSIFF